MREPHRDLAREALGNRPWIGIPVPRNGNHEGQPPVASVTSPCDIVHQLSEAGPAIEMGVIGIWTLINELPIDPLEKILPQGDDDGLAILASRRPAPLHVFGLVPKCANAAVCASFPIARPMLAAWHCMRWAPPDRGVKLLGFQTETLPPTPFAGLPAASVSTGGRVLVDDDYGALQADLADMETFVVVRA